MPLEQFERCPRIGTNDALSHYTNVVRLEEILQRKAIFFPRSTVLRDTDSQEGVPPPREQVFRVNDAKDRFGYPTKESLEYEGMREQLEALKANSDNMVVKCFHRNEGESTHMWQQFGSAEKGVMIRSTYASLCAGFACANEDLISAPVRYVEHESAIFYHPKHYPVPANNLLAPHILKATIYSHEAELRLIYAPNRNSWQWEEFWRSQENPKGLFIKVDPCLLIEEIVVPPGSSQEYVEHVQVLVNIYCPKVRVSRSSLES